MTRMKTDERGLYKAESLSYYATIIRELHLSLIHIYIMTRLRGPKDSEVKLTIVRRGVDDPLYFTVKRDKIPILSLDASYMIQPKICLLYTSSITRHGRADFHKHHFPGTRTLPCLNHQGTPAPFRRYHDAW